MSRLAGRALARRVVTVIAAVSLAACTNGGQATALKSSDEITISSLQKLRGTIVADARSAAPETPMRITGYTVEKLVLPRAVYAWVKGGRVVVRDAWRIAIRFDEPLTVRNQAFSLAIDDAACGFLQERPDLLSASSICFDSALLRNGASIGVAYKTVRITPHDDEPRAVNPDVIYDGPEPIYYFSVLLRLQSP